LAIRARGEGVLAQIYNYFGEGEDGKNSHLEKAHGQVKYELSPELGRVTAECS
jgi:hypothetical protein